MADLDVLLVLNKKIDTVISQNEELQTRLSEQNELIEQLTENISNINRAGSGFQFEDADDYED